ncbi:lipopolysaccharide biosynthesis protein [Fusobacterium polymorphum]|uniref:Uncharacterized protein n=1 Tax=Fusobacterium nucleatum subsp. polymorphum TaxID=76857 RepID=A0A241Q358_FUSNP|nr:oligosaccharide flippase family protein [Fusobacterium polymorphum]ASG29176.1 hypothetical protein CBG61_09955 [Fusobacterium polymorphum]
MHKLEKKDYNGIKAGIWYTIGNIIIKGIPFFTIPIFTRLLTTNDFGIYSIYLSYEEILSVVIGLGISGTVKIAKFEFKNEFEKYISSVLNLIAIVGILFLVISNLSYSFFTLQEWLSRFVVNLIIIQSISVAIYSVVSSKYVIDGDYIKNLLIVFFMTVLNIVISLILCISFLKSSPYLGRIIGTALGAIFIALFVIFKQNRISPMVSKKVYNRFALVLGLPLILHQLSISLLAQSDKIMIQTLVGNREAGIYSIGVIITSVLAVIISSIDSAWTPWFYSKLSEKRYDILIEKNNILVIFFMYLTSGFILISPDIIHVMTEKSYWDSIYTVIPLIISIYLNFMYVFSVGIEYFLKKTGFISMVTVTCVFLNIILNYFMIKQFGYIAAAYATCISRFFQFIFHYLMAKYLLGSKVVSTEYLIFSLIGVCIIGYITNIYIYSIFIRWGIIFIITIIILFYFYKLKIFDRFLNRSKR